MKLKHKLTLLLTVAVLHAQITHAMNYAATNADTLLVFREDNFNDVVFSVGNVSNLLAMPNGTTTNITYDTNLVKANFNNTFAGVKFIVVACNDSVTVPTRLWATDASLTVPATNVTVSKFGTIRSKIESVGNNAAAVTLGNASPFITAPSDPNAYSYVVTGGAGTAIGTFNGDVAFTVEASAGATQYFWEVAPSNLTPKPRSKFIGSFAMDATTGRVTFTSGTNAAVALVASKIVKVVRTSGVSQVSFTTTNGNNYRLLYSTNLVTWLTNAAAGTIAGNNATNILSDTNAAGRVFYRIQSY